MAPLDVFEKKKIIFAIQKSRVEWKRHVLERILVRGISTKDVLDAISKGEILELYNDDKPFPSGLFFKMCVKKPLHVVVAHDKSKNMLFIITAYEPTLDHFMPDFRTRRAK